MRSRTQCCQSLTAAALAALILSSASAQSVTTRLVNAGTATTTAKAVPGGSVSIDIRLDIATAAIFGTGFTLTQLSPVTSGYFSITGRSFAGSPFDDATSGTSDATVLAAPSSLLDPANDNNLGRTTVGLVGIPPAANVLAVNLTLASSAATPLGEYAIGPTPLLSFATDTPEFNDYDMSGGIPLTIIIGQPLTVTQSGTGAGTVTADSGLINCGAICTDIYPGTVVTLTATPSGGSSFAGWSGAGCSGTGTCVVTVDAAKTINAQFPGFVVDFGLLVTKAGTGTGTVSSVPFGINCGTVCTVFASPNMMFTLTATPSVGSIFAGWSGAGCSGTGACLVTVASAGPLVTATFNATQRVLTVAKAGDGVGTVTSNIGGINCGTTCSSSVNDGTVVTLTAIPGANSILLGWSGAGCSGTGPCLVTVNAATTVTATFIHTDPSDTTIDSGPSNPSNVANPTFTFSSTDLGSAFQCSLDGQPFAGCVSPHTVHVTNGLHTFAVFATDTAGNTDLTPATYTWTVANATNSFTPIPVLNELMLALLALLLGSVGVAVFRRRN